MTPAIPDIPLTGTKEAVNGVPKTIVPSGSKLVEVDVPPWVHLVSQPKSWRKQLYIRGRRLTARHVVGAMASSGRSADEIARDYDIPVAAVHESWLYCEQNADLISREIEEERRGVDFTPRVKS